MHQIGAYLITSHSVVSRAPYVGIDMAFAGVLSAYRVQALLIEHQNFRWLL